MNMVIFFLLLYHLILIGTGAAAYYFLSLNHILCEVSILGLVGGCTYCIKAIYTQCCVKKEWENVWVIWHLARPAVSAVCGVVSFLFIQTGLLVLGAYSDANSSHYGIYALAFIAGLNVDNFLDKIESISKEFFGIQKSRLSRKE